MVELARECRRERVDRVRSEADDRDDHQQREEFGVPAKQPQPVAHPRRSVRALARAWACRDGAEREREIRHGVDGERGGDPDRGNGYCGERGTGSAGDVVGHRVERDGRRHVRLGHERRDECLRRRRAERGRHAEREARADDERSGGVTAPRDGCERRRDRNRHELTRHDQTPPIEAVRRRPRPRREQERRHEVREREDAEEELRVSQAVDQQRRRKVVEPAAARRERVADEVRPEAPAADEPRRRARPGRVPFGHRTPLPDRAA